jgi:hypothetical protein
MVLLVGVALYNVYRGREVNRSLCEATVDNRNSLRSVLIEQRAILLEDATSFQETSEIIADSGRLLAVVPPITCSSSGEPQEPSLPEPSSQP